MTPIVDAHHHIWRRADLPWLDGPMQPRIFGPYEAIRRDYPISEYLSDIAGSEVIRSVYVQANWAKDAFEDEVAYVQRAADETGYPQAIVGYADFLVDDVRPQLDRLTKYRGMRGLRMQLHWHENPQYRFAAKPDLAREPLLQRNVARLADYGWSFDLQVFAGQMDGAADLAAACPKVTFVLQHAGMLEDLSATGRTQWRAAMHHLAARPNVVSKLSALGTFIHRNDPVHIATVVRQTVEVFGPARCMFGSNFPIEKLWTRYGDLVAAYRRALEPLGETTARAVLRDTATSIYRLN
ncbi:MAG TPA: amidohydrolase family protein [Xanthobacteraceae bacterium]|nr:amidohydrolase family protein [Xanthobacteraceae bacterium]